MIPVPTTLVRVPLAIRTVCGVLQGEKFEKSDLSPVMCSDAPESTTQEECGDVVACIAAVLELFLELFPLFPGVLLIFALCISCWSTSIRSFEKGMELLNCDASLKAAFPFALQSRLGFQSEGFPYICQQVSLRWPGFRQ